jgi:hypothetical protein
MYSDQAASINVTTRQTERIRAIAKCLICKLPGHNKAKCPLNVDKNK